MHSALERQLEWRFCHTLLVIWESPIHIPQFVPRPEQSHIRIGYYCMLQCLYYIIIIILCFLQRPYRKEMCLFCRCSYCHRYCCFNICVLLLLLYKRKTQIARKRIRRILRVMRRIGMKNNAQKCQRRRQYRTKIYIDYARRRGQI